LSKRGSTRPTSPPTGRSTAAWQASGQPPEFRRHCEERSDEAISGGFGLKGTRLPRFARNDLSAVKPPSLALLSAVTALAFCSLQMVVPVLPLLVVVFDDSAAQVQLVLSLYLAGIAAGQLVYGPASDRFGRRPVLLAG